jgi:PAS domain-containing protein
MNRDRLTRQAALLIEALDSIDQGILVYDENLTVIAFNQRALDTLELPHNRFAIGGSFEGWVRYTAEHGARTFAPYRSDQTRLDDKVVEIRDKPIPTAAMSRPIPTSPNASAPPRPCATAK